MNRAQKIEKKNCKTPVRLKHYSQQGLAPTEDVSPFPSLIALQRSVLKWSFAEARGGRDGREEGRERGYYNLHHKLQNTFLVHSS